MSSQANVPAIYEKPPISNMPIDELEKLISNISAELYMRGGQRLTPIPPFVLVRVIPKELTTVGGIILPDVRQNKPAFEGIVLETYAPYEEEVVLKKRDGDVVEEYIGKIHRECPVKMGQRVIFPYYEGIDHGILGQSYKLIRCSADQIQFPYSQILGTLDYEGDLIIQYKIVELMEQFKSITRSGVAVSRGEDPA